MSKLAAIFGAGGRVGKSVALKLLQEGYQVAAVSRTGVASLDEEAETYKDSLRRYRADLTRAEDAVSTWKQIKDDFGMPISVCLHNAYSNSGAGKFLDYQTSLDDLRKEQELNTLSVFALIREAIRDFKELPSAVPKLFIYTGNALDDPKTFPHIPSEYFSLAVGKFATIPLLDIASQEYGPLGYKFYYIDEHLADGGPGVDKISGPAHADMVWELLQDPKQGHWRVAFIKGRGKV